MANEASNYEASSLHRAQLGQRELPSESTIDGTSMMTETTITTELPSRELTSVHHSFDMVTPNDSEARHGDESVAVVRAKKDMETNKSSDKDDDTDDKIPEKFLCPITHELMTDPVCSPYGHNYQRSAIIEWLAKDGGRHTCPMTRQPMGPWQLATNQTLRGQIRQWQIKTGVKNPIPIEPKSGELRKEVFLLFLRVLLKYLKHTKSPVYPQVKDTIQEFQNRKVRGESCYLVTMRRQIQALVPEGDWKRTEIYVRHLLATKRCNSTS